MSNSHPSWLPGPSTRSSAGMILPARLLRRCSRKNSSTSLRPAWPLENRLLLLCGNNTTDVHITRSSDMESGARERGGFGCFSPRSEEHTSELQSLMRNSYAVFCLKQKKHKSQQS